MPEHRLGRCVCLAFVGRLVCKRVCNFLTFFSYMTFSGKTLILLQTTVALCRTVYSTYIRYLPTVR